jgi:hypothetical protein
MDDRGKRFNGKTAQGVGDGGGNEIGVGGLPLEDHPEADHGVWPALLDHPAGKEGNLKGPRGVDDLRLGERFKGGDLLLGLGEHRIHELGVVTTGDKCKPMGCILSQARSGWDGFEHGKQDEG